MKNYNFTAENIDEINRQKSEFFSLISEQSSNLIDLQVLSYSELDNAEKLFWTKFIQNHEEIRGDIKLTRYFILRKKDKLVKELKTSLFMSNIYDNLMEETKNEYWKFVHTVFLLLESYHNEKNDAIINTLTSELEKILNKEQEQEEEQDKKEDKKEDKKGEKKVKNRKMGRLKNKENDFDMSKMNEMFGKMSGGLDMSKIGEMMGGLDLSKIGEMMGGLMNNNGSENIDMSKIGEMMGGLMNNNGSEKMENIDMGKMLNTLMPGVENKKNDVLMQDLMNDITSKMSNIESSEQVFEITTQLGEKYQNMITSGEINSSEILGSLMGLMTDKKFTEELSKIDMSKINPEEMVTKMMEKVSPEILGGVNNENMDLSNIGSLISGITGGQKKETEPVKEQDLTQEQLKEMEDYYSKLEIETKIEELNVD